ncbi:MAG: hypothetical protein ACE5PT_05855 [Gemmatimonadales bacterium]
MSGTRGSSTSSGSCEAALLLPLIRRLRDERRELGWKGLLKKRGWKLVAVVVLFYLVRDLLIYVLIPLAIVARLTR